MPVGLDLVLIPRRPELPPLEELKRRCRAWWARWRASWAGRRSRHDRASCRPAALRLAPAADRARCASTRSACGRCCRRCAASSPAAASTSSWRCTSTARCAGPARGSGASAAAIPGIRVVRSALSRFPDHVGRLPEPSATDGSGEPSHNVLKPPLEWFADARSTGVSPVARSESHRRDACATSKRPPPRNANANLPRRLCTSGSIGQRIGLHRRGKQRIAFSCAGAWRLALRSRSATSWASRCCVCSSWTHGRRPRGAEVDAELVVGDAQLVVGQQGRPADALAVDARAVGAAQVAQQQQAVGLDDDAVHLRDALVLQPQVAVLLAADHDQVLDDLDRSRPRRLESCWAA